MPSPCASVAGRERRWLRARRSRRTSGLPSNRRTRFRRWPARATPRRPAIVPAQRKDLRRRWPAPVGHSRWNRPPWRAGRPPGSSERRLRPPGRCRRVARPCERTGMRYEKLVLPRPLQRFVAKRPLHGNGNTVWARKRGSSAPQNPRVPTNDGRRAAPPPVRRPNRSGPILRNRRTRRAARQKEGRRPIFRARGSVRPLPTRVAGCQKAEPGA